MSRTFTAIISWVYCIPLKTDPVPVWMGNIILGRDKSFFAKTKKHQTTKTKNQTNENKNNKQIKTKEKPLIHQT